ncbi:hypothetical protein RD728_002311 [Enterococcus faecalis]|nr:DUF6037 family protein [Enterococcus faecalis]EKZ0520106.1 hypothetical protein [Enterococcus faecalis]
MIGLFWENLKSLLSDMKEKGWNITGCSFDYNEHEFVALISRAEEDLKEFPLATSKIIIYKDSNLNEELVCYSLEHWLHVDVPRFYNFFELKGSNNIPFKKILARFIRFLDKGISPTFKKDVKVEINQAILKYVSVSDSDDPDKLYCFSVGHSRKRKNGEPGRRSSFNTEKTKRLRETLFEKLGKFEELSFRYTKNPLKEKEDWEIIRNFENRNKK